MYVVYVSKYFDHERFGLEIGENVGLKPLCIRERWLLNEVRMYACMHVCIYVCMHYMCIYVCV
jgi:hypothetical protein